MIKTMENAERDAAIRVADSMAAAARTAPKGSGKDKIVTREFDTCKTAYNSRYIEIKPFGADFFVKFYVFLSACL